jgi:aldehyde dehydrogenase (NAD+)
MIEKRQFYINGKWTDPAKVNDHNVINPSNEEPCAVITLGSKADTDAAVAAAKAAFPAWMNTPPATRIALVEKLQKVYNARAEDMAQAISLEMGAPIELAREQQTAAGSGHIADFVAAAKEFEFEHQHDPDTPGSYIRNEPIGVAALITPWNWPMNQVTLKVVAAAVAGCTMVLKPSEESPLSAMVFAEMMDEAGFPPGVFNLVNGDGVGVGTQLSEHPDVDMVSFTGSSRAGKLISKAAAETLKRVSLELGGKGANLVFADADKDAVQRGVEHCMNNSGQSCNAPTRMIVQREVYDQAVETAAKVASSIKVGPASEAGDHIGPVVNEVQFNKIQDLIQKGIDEGARLVAGGVGRPDGLNRGFYVKPTVFADVNNDMVIAREEIFGPVCVVNRFETEAEAVQLANDTRYGLNAMLFTENLSRAHRVSSNLRAGTVWVNCFFIRDLRTPFGGVGDSGVGREGGNFSREFFTEPKAVVMQIDRVVPGT